MKSGASLFRFRAGVPRQEAPKVPAIWILVLTNFPSETGASFSFTVHRKVPVGGQSTYTSTNATEKTTTFARRSRKKHRKTEIVRSVVRRGQRRASRIIASHT
jgi:hypothetical protein